MRAFVPLAALLLALPGCIQVLPHGPCLRVSLYPESATVRPGNATLFAVRAQNCGDVALTLGDGGICDAGNGLNLTFVAQGVAYRLGHAGGAIPLGRADKHVCGDVAGPPRTLAPGESQEASAGWNGTLMGSTCFDAACAERYHDAPPGDYPLLARVEPREGGAFETRGVAHVVARS
jgi:hypothetical protein